MTCRRHGTRPTLAFWMLVALADVALIVASVGVVALLAVLAVVVTGAAGWRVVRRGIADQQDIGAPAVAQGRDRRRA